jgi:hypothetical protein
MDNISQQLLIMLISLNIIPWIMPDDNEML